ncbi:MAG: hypothetical protein RL676_71 [Pseudomonadota bacterium]|jgi:phospholipid-binding lipoprotein MlaA
MTAVIHRFLLAFTLAALTGCASLPAGHADDPRDPWERYNRAMFEFNDGLDRTVIKPVAEAYRDVVPDALQLMVRNFFGNLRDIATTVQQLLQGKPAEAGNTAARVAFNSTLGFLGLGDIASDMGFRKTSEDFGQTFGAWGAEPGPYVVIPVFGPSTLRDTFGFVLDVALDPRDAVIASARDRNIARGLVAIDRRRELLDTERTLDALSFDRYMAVRDAWLAHRRSQVYDGDPPPLPYKDE